ncbi:MAG: hypothetical protein ACLGI5_11280 [Thermoleophilia bacterium]
MRGRRIAAIAVSGALVAGGTGAAIAAVGDKDGKQAEQAVLDDAAKRLDVTPQKLREALAAAQDAQLDEAVKAGRLTQKQADAIKQARKQSGRVLGPMRGGMHGRPFDRGGPGALGMRHGLLDDIATALGTTPAKLSQSLRSGKSVAEIAKANGKSLADVRTAVSKALKTRLDKAVADGDLTRRQADEMLEHAEEKIKSIAAGRTLGMRRHGGPRRGQDHGGMRPGSLVPGAEAPQVAPRGGTTHS